MRVDRVDSPAIAGKPNVKGLAHRYCPVLTTERGSGNGPNSIDTLPIPCLDALNVNVVAMPASEGAEHPTPTQSDDTLKKSIAVDDDRMIKPLRHVLRDVTDSSLMVVYLANVHYKTAAAGNTPRVRQLRLIEVRSN